ncbi:hypothetical protein BGX26_006383 [Mortierella sp. AD094]|nr:hypothetical protein BGX26_006383 [Mortierella sp. AD094]
MIDISDLEANSVIAFSGTDYGLKTMSECVPMTRSGIEIHLNRFDSLQGLEPDLDPDPDPGNESNAPKLETMESARPLKTSESNKITAARINELSHTRMMTLKQQRRVQGNKEVCGALKRLADVRKNINDDPTLENIDKATVEMRESRGIIQPFHNSNKRKHEKRHTNIMTKVAYSKLAAIERGKILKYTRDDNLDIQAHQPQNVQELSSPIYPASNGWCVECQAHHLPSSMNGVLEYDGICPRSIPESATVMFIGTAGTCVGSRIKGHARRGSSKLRKEHGKNCVVAMTDEFLTSKICVYCYQQTRLAQAKRTINGVTKTVHVNGAAQCYKSVVPIRQDPTCYQESRF